MSLTTAERFNINISGKGETPLMFAHGLGCDQSMWRFITPFFEEDYKIILFDHLGSGNSDIASYNKSKYSSLDAYADDVVEIISFLQLRDVIFVGHSVGSMIGMLAAIKSPELFKNLVLVGPSPCYINSVGYIGGFEPKEIEDLLQQLKESLLDWSDKFAPVIMGVENHPVLSEELRDSFLSTDHELLYHFAKLTFEADLRANVPNLKIPSLILQCSEDIIAPENVGEFMHQQLPLSKLVKMKATGHCAHLSEPHETVDAIKAYLQGI